jgi:hypothetical protein
LAVMGNKTSVVITVTSVLDVTGIELLSMSAVGVVTIEGLML